MESSLKLQRRPLGSTGLSVSVLGLGTVKFGRNQNIKYPAFNLPEDTTICRLLDDALDSGINVLDTAPAYGTAEERLGNLLGSRRDQFIIITKTGEEFFGGKSTYNFSSEHTLQSVERSLRRLRTDRLDCVLVHCPRNDWDCLANSPVLETLQRLKERGDIRSFGASINSVKGGMLALNATDVVMVTHSVEYTSEEQVIQRANELNKGVLIKKGLASGVLATGLLKDKLRPIFALDGVSSLIVGTIDRNHLRSLFAASSW